MHFLMDLYIGDHHFMMDLYIGARVDLLKFCMVVVKIPLAI